MGKGKSDLYDFIYDLQNYSPEQAFVKIAKAGLNDTEIAMVVKIIAMNNPFKFKK